MFYKFSLLQLVASVALTANVETSVLEIAVLVCVRAVLVLTASVDLTANAPRKASSAASQSEL